MKNKQMMHNRGLFFLIMLIVAGILGLVYLAITGNGDQVFTDIVIGDAIAAMGNKSAEMRLVFTLAIGGVIAYAIHEYFLLRKDASINSKYDNQKISPQFEMLSLLAVVLIGPGIVYAKINSAILGSLIVVVIYFLFAREYVLHGVVFYYLAIYAVIAGFRIYVMLGGLKDITLSPIIWGATIVSLLILCMKDREKVLRHGILSLQMVIPFLLLLYISSRYEFEGKIITLHVPYRAQTLIWGLILMFAIEAGILIKRNWTHTEIPDKLISYGACISMMAYNRFNGDGAIMTIDMHHHFENVLGYSQVFEQKQRLFMEYVPVSGLYSLVEGAVFKLFGHGQMSNYYLSNNLFYLFVIILVIILLRAQAKASVVFLFAILFTVLDYNRVALILPTMLLLIMPRLVKNRNLWLKCWMLTSLVHGLYYPLLGAAVCVGFLPLGIFQIVTYAKSGELKRDSSSFTFWLWWLACLLPVMLAVPCLWGTYRHVRAMSGQSILADGIARFGQAAAGDFFPYLNNSSVRTILYLLFSFLLPVGLVWLSCAVVCKTAGLKLKKRKLCIQNMETACLGMSVLIMPLIAYTFTFVRMDAGRLYARNAGVLYAGAVILVVVACRYIKTDSFRLGIILAALLIPCAVNQLGVNEVGNHLNAYQEVPEGYIYVTMEDTGMERVGEGYISPDLLAQIIRYRDEYAQMDQDSSYLGTMPLYGFYYLMGVNGDSLLETTPIKGFEAVQETIDIARKNKTRIGSKMGWYENYYFYHWLLDSGEYYWSSELGLWIPNEGTYTIDEIHEKSKWAGMSPSDYNVGCSAGIMGNSMDSLQGVFAEVPVEYSMCQEGESCIIQLQDILNGEDADFIYLEFDGMEQEFEYTSAYSNEEVTGKLLRYFMRRKYNPGKQVEIRWLDDDMESHSMTCEMEKGKLLIPIGAGLRWLYHDHTMIQLSVTQGDTEVQIPEITQMKFLKLREVQ